MVKLQFCLKVPLSSSGTVSVSSMQFGSWFPLEDAIKYTCNGFDVKLSFPFELISGQVEEPAKIVNHSNICLHYVQCHVTGEIDEFLGEYIKNIDYKESPSSNQLEVELLAISKKIRLSCIKGINRLIQYVKFIKKQYWMIEYDHTSQAGIREFFILSKSVVKFPDGYTKSFYPRITDPILVLMPDTEKMITAEDWEKIKEFIISENRIPGYLEFIDNSRLLLDFGFYRSAIVEGVSALETALNAALKSGSLERKIKQYHPGINDFETACKHLGFSTTFRCLLSHLLYGKEFLYSDCTNCCKAISIRNGIVHNGQRGLTYDKCAYLLNSIDRFIAFMIEE